MPRKTTFGMEHVKSVKRNGKTYLYFNTGQKVDGKPIYTPLGIKGQIEVGQRYTLALIARTKRAGTSTDMTVPQLVQRFERSPDFCKKSVGTQTTYSVYLRRLANEFNTAPAAHLDPSDIYQLIDEMGARPAAIDMMILAGKQMYGWGKKRKYVAHNPFDEIDREDWLGRTYEPWPEEALNDALSDDRLRLPSALLYFTGQRIGDCCNARWDDIKPDGRVHIKQQKTGKDMKIRIHAQLQAVLDEAPRHGDTILADSEGKKLKDQTLRMWIKRFGAERGLDLVPHGLRKNAVNALLEAGCSTGEVSSITGQSLKMVELYALRRNNERMSDGAMAKWERAGNRETLGKTEQEMAE